MPNKKKRVLIAGLPPEVLKSVSKERGFKNYLVESVDDGESCLEIIKSFHPDLIFADLLLAKLHGVELLKIIKKDPELQKIGVVIFSSQILVQNYRAALDHGADYFLNLPSPPEKWIDVMERYFEGRLFPDPFENVIIKEKIYSPTEEKKESLIRFWGTRGSTPVSGAPYVRFGGNTSCLEIVDGDDLVIIDAGTGIRNLGLRLARAAPRKIDLFLGHYHWDHLIGLPFFAPLYIEGFEIAIWGPVSFDHNIREIFSLLFSPEYFPIRLDEVHAKITLNNLHNREKVEIGGIQVETEYTYHPGVSFGFKVRAGQKKFGYITDNEVLKGFRGDPRTIEEESELLLPHRDQIEFLKGCDFIIHEAQYFLDEYGKKIGWGHSSIANAAILMKYCEAKKWIVTHHDPDHDDRDLEQKITQIWDVIRECKMPCTVKMAYDNLVIPLRK
jgi:ribonuclease BN (tRNA processing enzyme)